MIGNNNIIPFDTAAPRPADLARQGGCRFCGARLEYVFVDLGPSPLANTYLKQDELSRGDKLFPLRVFVCAECFLVQLDERDTPETLFTDSTHFATVSATLLQHAKAYVAAMMERFKISEQSIVVEIGSNEGYLLQYFVEQHVPVLGIEPAQSAAAVARTRGIPTRVDFFGERTARALYREGMRADLVIGNNVLAHVPDVNDFVKGLRILLDKHGVITVEFPHLMRLYADCQIDTIYHEHFSYFSFITAEKIFAAHAITLFDVEELPTHGGSLRIFGQRAATGRHPVTERLVALRQREIDAGFTKLNTYLAFGECSTRVKRQLMDFLTSAKRAGKRVVGYGAPAQGNTLLNYCGIGSQLIEYTVDRNPHKQGRFLPGTHIPIYEPERISVTKPDYILILPWDLKAEIINQLSFARGWGAQFVVPIPKPQIID
jgi:SAM-dependent methyltransferase